MGVLRLGAFCAWHTYHLRMTHAEISPYSLGVHFLSLQSFQEVGGILRLVRIIRITYTVWEWMCPCLDTSLFSLFIYFLIHFFIGWEEWNWRHFGHDSHILRMTPCQELTGRFWDWRRYQYDLHSLRMISCWQFPCVRNSICTPEVLSLITGYSETRGVLSSTYTIWKCPHTGNSSYSHGLIVYTFRRTLPILIVYISVPSRGSMVVGVLWDGWDRVENSSYSHSVNFFSLRPFIGKRTSSD